MSPVLQRMTASLTLRRWLVWASRPCVFALIAGGMAQGGDAPDYARDIEPLLKHYCFDCHGDGESKGKISLDTFRSEQERLASKELWLKALKNLRAGLMPPERKPQPTKPELHTLETWIKSAVFDSNPDHPDPGSPVVRRLNRLEYRNTIKDLMGVDYNTEVEFPADDTGHGFDNIGSVLTLSPMMIEKYLAAARSIVEQSVPSASRIAPERRIHGNAFLVRTPPSTNSAPAGAKSGDKANTLSLPYYTPGAAEAAISIEHAGRYQLTLNLTATEKHVESQFDLNRCRLLFKIDGATVLTNEFTREGNRAFHYDFERSWKAGEHRLAVELQPLTPGEKAVRSLAIRIDGVTLRGPLDNPKNWVRPKNYERFFGSIAPAGGPKARRAQSREILGRFASRAFRRPVEPETLERLVALADSVASQKGKTFEEGIQHGMVAVLASPRFLFREEKPAPGQSGEPYPWVDDYSLASRLSYFLWSSMPDEELIRLAATNGLRSRVPEQLNRMLADKRSESFVRSFVGQWLQSRDVESVPIESRSVMGREFEPDPEVEKARKRFRELREREPESLSADEKADLARSRETFFKSFGRFNRYELTGELRSLMRQETERYFEYVLKEDRSLLELIDSDYTFLNKKLAEVYGVDGVEGDSLRRVVLDTKSPRGGILTQGSFLIVTSNPTRTSPVKRGLFLLDNILGMPIPPPPPDVPALEENAQKNGGKELSLRETLAIHREKPLCSSCHNRMDPLGLAFENFNALGRWREKEKGQVLDPAGRLITGESFANVKELKHVLATQRSDDFYRCIVEKLLTYALGRGLEYYDLQTQDSLVDALRASGGKPSVLLRGILQSAPFQRIRSAEARPAHAALSPP